MKKLAFIVLACITFSAVAQKTAVDKFLKKYDWGQGIAMNEMKPGSQEFCDEMKLNGKAVDELLKKVDKLIIVKGDSASDLSARKSFYSSAFDVLKNEEYKNVVQVNSDDGDKVGIYTSQHKNGNFHEIVFLLIEEDNLLMMIVKGDFDMSEFGLGDLMKIFDRHEHNKDYNKEDEYDHGQDRGD